MTFLKQLQLNYLIYLFYSLFGQLPKTPLKYSV